MGALVGRRGAYRYLVTSLTHLPPPQELCEMLHQAGFAACVARPLTGGMVTLFTATRRLRVGNGNERLSHEAPIDRRS
jgi:ubiquinone/menaquinone biosynthesis C-methylase UbiE